MPRQPRYFIPDIPQHVMQRGVNQQPTFFASEDYRLYLKTLRSAISRYDCRVHAYVLMTNHIHLLMTPGDENSIPRVMQAIGREYVQELNRRHDRTGTLWQGRYKACLVQDDHYLLTCYRYIELNPVRAGMVDAPGNYPYSSYHHNALGKPDCLLSKHPVYTALSNNRRKRLRTYRKMFGDVISADRLGLLRDATNACGVLGDASFIDRVEKQLGRRACRRRPGRPPRTDNR